MKTNCRSQLESALEPLQIDRLARQTGFRRRKPKKLWPLTFLQSCCLLLVEKKVSFRRWAMLIGVLTNKTYAKQSLFERMTGRAVAFVQGVVLRLVGQLSLGQERVLPAVLAAFKRLLIHDSTIVTLPAKLARFFPGSRNQRGSKAGMIRLQGLYDLKHECFIHFSHSAFRRNDQALAHEVLAYLRAGDLLLRDLGYLVLWVLREIQKRKAFFLSRFKHNLLVFRSDGRPLDLVALLSHRTAPLDQDVLVGAQEQLPVRLVALKVSEEVANLRRHRARHNRHHPHPSQKHLLLLGWDLLMTNASPQQLPTAVVAKVYHLRFHIETIFKAWKSHFQLQDVPAGSRTQVETLLYARLLLITIFQVCFLARWQYQFQDQASPLSLLKVAAFMQLYLPVTLLGELQPHLEAALQRQVPYHCGYEKRRNRKNFVQQLELT
ncbi:MAG TPA: IS4 family transposase [Candidatus Sulfotelmatobacter sp.]|nr:IS4 family transposase [Candidatus Sulfotelmatobacter sp.]